MLAVQPGTQYQRPQVKKHGDGIAASEVMIGLDAVMQAVTGRVIRTGQGWKTNLEWGPCDVILLEKGMQLRVTKQTLQEMQLPAVAKLWKVRHISCA